MAEKDLDPTRSITAPGPLIWLAQLSAYASAIVSIFGIVFLIAFFTLGGVFGPLNDVAVVIQYILMTPIAFALHQQLRSVSPLLSVLALTIGIAGMLAVIILQALLVARLLSFSRQIVLVVPAFLTVLAWFLLNRSLGGESGIVPEGLLLTVLAGLYLGYPIWGFSLGRRLTDGTQHRPR